MRIVINNESEKPELLGEYAGTDANGDLVVIVEPNGTIARAPYDCVSVVEVDLSGTPWALTKLQPGVLDPRD